MSAQLVGVLGGVGPAATAYFLQRLVERTAATCDQEHIRTLAFNDTAIPDRTAFLTGVSARNPLESLVEDGLLLEACGCDLLALPCNTAHGFFDELQAQLHVPLINMVRATMERAAASGLRRVGVLATQGTVLRNLYGEEAQCYGIECAYPGLATQHEVNRLIFDQVKAGAPVEHAALIPLAASLGELGCDGVVLGCTELSFAFSGVSQAAGLPIIDALDVLADSVIELAGRSVRAAEAPITRDTGLASKACSAVL